MKLDKVMYLVMEYKVNIRSQDWSGPISFIDDSSAILDIDELLLSSNPSMLAFFDLAITSDHGH